MSDTVSVTQALLSRHSCRAFTDRPVNPALVRALLGHARFAPSGGNLQPWLVQVVSGAALARFRVHMAPKIAASPLGETAEYKVYPDNLQEPYRTRRFQVGEELYALIGVDRQDKAGRIRQYAKNFDFFNAPVALFFFIDRCMGAPQWSDVGMFMQSLMLLAREQGLDTCPQESWSAWHREVAEFLKVGPQLLLFCGMALGYADAAAPINRLRAPRAAVEEFATFHD